MTKNMQPTMTATEAGWRIEYRIKDTVEQLRDTARLTDESGTDSLPCRWEDDGIDDRVFVERDYEIVGLDVAEHRDEYFDTVQRYWEKRGYRKTRYHRNDPYRVMVYTDPDGIRLVLQTDADGNHLFLGGQSPCIWPHGTPPQRD